jgi:hypothetical protein
MNAERVIGTLLILLTHHSTSWCMNGSFQEVQDSCHKHMVQFSLSLNELAQEVTDLSKQQIGNRNCGPIDRLSLRCPINLGKIDAMRAHLGCIRTSLNTESASQHNLKKTDVLYEIQAIFKHLDTRLGDTRTLLNAYNASHQRGKLLHNALDPLVDIQENLNGLFGICSGHPYVSPHKNTIIQVLLTEARSFSWMKTFMVAQSLANPSVGMSGRQSPISRNQSMDFSEQNIAIGVMYNDQTGSSSSWSDNIRKSIAQYEKLYEDRARIAIDLAKNNPQHISSVFADLSHRLCGTEFCNETKENLGLIEKLCMEYPEDSQTLLEMRAEGSLTAQKLALLLKATMPSAVASGGDILERVEAVVSAAENPGDGAIGYVKQQASQFAVNMAKKTGVVNEKQINSLTKYVKEGNPFSKRVQKVTRIIKQYHLEGMVNTMIATLEGFDKLFTIMMGRAADFYMECGKDSPKILKIVRDLKGYNITATCEYNKALLGYLNRLKNAWENPGGMIAIQLSLPYEDIDGDAVSDSSYETASNGLRQEDDGLEDEFEERDMTWGHVELNSADDGNTFAPISGQGNNSVVGAGDDSEIRYDKDYDSDFLTSLTLPFSGSDQIKE